MERETEEKTGKNVHQGANVRRLRNIMGVKQSSLAEMLGTTQQKVSRIESQRVIEQNMLVYVLKHGGQLAFVTRVGGRNKLQRRGIFPYSVQRGIGNI